LHGDTRTVFLAVSGRILDYDASVRWTSRPVAMTFSPVKRQIGVVEDGLLGSGLPSATPHGYGFETTHQHVTLYSLSAFVSVYRGESRRIQTSSRSPSRIGVLTQESDFATLPSRPFDLVKPSHLDSGP